MKNQEIDRDTIVEFISDNRLQEALQALEKLTRGTHLHNQVVVLSSSYAEYSQLNRNAAQDFQTLEMQRTRISNLYSDKNKKDVEIYKIINAQ